MGTSETQTSHETHRQGRACPQPHGPQPLTIVPQGPGRTAIGPQRMRDPQTTASGSSAPHFQLEPGKGIQRVSRKFLEPRHVPSGRRDELVRASKVHYLRIVLTCEKGCFKTKASFCFLHNIYSKPGDYNYWRESGRMHQALCSGGQPSRSFRS